MLYAELAVLMKTVNPAAVLQYHTGLRASMLSLSLFSLFFLSLYKYRRGVEPHGKKHPALSYLSPHGFHNKLGTRHCNVTGRYTWYARTVSTTVYTAAKAQLYLYSLQPFPMCIIWCHTTMTVVIRMRCTQQWYILYI